MSDPWADDPMTTAWEPAAVFAASHIPAEPEPPKRRRGGAKVYIGGGAVALVLFIILLILIF